jgi:hypothetical protein
MSRVWCMPKQQSLNDLLMPDLHNADFVGDILTEPGFLGDLGAIVVAFNRSTFSSVSPGKERSAALVELSRSIEAREEGDKVGWLESGASVQNLFAERNSTLTAQERRRLPGTENSK